MKIANTQEMRYLEQATDASGHSYAEMMEAAGNAVGIITDKIILMAPDKNVLVLVGPGNNGGDGLVAARFLLEAGHLVTVYIWKRDVRGDDNFRRLKRRRRGIAILWADNDQDYAKLREEIRRADLVLDALLGTGATRPIEGSLAVLLAVIREELKSRWHPPYPELPIPYGMPRFPIAEAQSLGMRPPPGLSPLDWDEEFDELFDEDDEDDEGDEDDQERDTEPWSEEDEYPEEAQASWPVPPVVAVDCPSGLNCDTGAVDPATLPAHLTITFGLPKWGQVQYPGAGACGVLSVAEIDLLPALVDELQAELVEAETVQRWLPARPADANKGTFGKAMVVAGSLNYTGAAYLSGSAAARAGAGLVTLAIPAPLHPSLAGALPEVTWLPLPGPDGTHSPDGLPLLLDRLSNYDALLVGPGLTTTEAARRFVEGLFSPDTGFQDAWSARTVVDADALNILAALPDWPSRLPHWSILTPHPGEMARLTGEVVAEINAQRIHSARRWSAEWNQVVLLKGAHTVIAAPDGRLAVLPFAVPTLATAGSGDVLAGAIVAMLAQGKSPFEAAVCGAYLHGHTGLLLARSIGLAGATARDILEYVPRALRQLYRGR
jgi:ADP-dependent NAD(P)H-hydrate dehydratase / NAD(P)H-hydrate epimerase